MSFKLFSHCAVDGVNKRVREKMDAKDQIKFLRLDMQTHQLCLPCWTLVRNHKHIHLRLLYTKQQMINFNSTQQMIIFKVFKGAMFCNSPSIQLVPLQQALQIHSPFTLLQLLPSAPQSQVWVQLAPHVPAEQSGETIRSTYTRTT